MKVAGWLVFWLCNWTGWTLSWIMWGLDWVTRHIYDYMRHVNEVFDLGYGLYTDEELEEMAFLPTEEDDDEQE